MTLRRPVRLVFGPLLILLGAPACSSSAPPGDAATTSSASSVSAVCSIGGGQCLVAVQNFYARYGVRVGVAPEAGHYDADGRWCAGEGACLIWVLDIPSSYGWVRTDSPGPYDLAVFPPHPGNAYGHITIVHHVDDGGVWMIDSNDANDERPNDTPHLHSAAPYGYYHYGDSSALADCGAVDGPPPEPPPPDPGPPPSDDGASCQGFNDALYCGSDYVHGDPSTLYRCSGGVAYIEQVCENGCQSNPDGANDACN